VSDQYSNFSRRGLLLIVLERMASFQISVQEQFSAMSAEFDHLKAEVAESTGVAQSLRTLVTGLAQQIRDLKDDPAALEALANELDADQKLSEAVMANPSGGPAPAPEPTPQPAPGPDDVDQA
jgi:TolA-binding protein